VGTRSLLPRLADDQQKGKIPVSSVIQTILARKSVRAYEEQAIPVDVRDTILQAALRAPTAGNMMLYSVLFVSDQEIKEKLVKTCDNQPFIARAPLVLLFLADYQRWYDYFKFSGVRRYCEAQGSQMLKPEEGDLFLACCDALVAAQTAVLAAESLGVGSCYIGDIMENYETHKDLFDLPQYVFPICLLCFGYPTEQQKRRPMTPRFDSRYVVFENQYKRLSEDELRAMMHDRSLEGKAEAGDQINLGLRTYRRKFSADFAVEMRRSVRAMLDTWCGPADNP
jgi:nitroreductase